MGVGHGARRGQRLLMKVGTALICRVVSLPLNGGIRALPQVAR